MYSRFLILIFITCEFNSFAQHNIKYGDQNYMELDSTIMSKRWVIKSKILNGYWKVYNNGILLEECAVIDSEKNGPDILYDFDGHQLVERDYTNDTLNGFYKEYSSDETIIIYFSMNKEQNSRQFDKEGNIEYAQFYLGSYHIENSFYKNGKKKQEYIILDSSYRNEILPYKYSLNITMRTFFLQELNNVNYQSLPIATDDLDEECDIHDDQSKKGVITRCIDFQNLSYAWYESGTIKEKIIQTDSLGTEKDYFYPNGKLKKRGHYLLNLRNGPWYYYDENGNLKKKEYYKDGYISK